MGLEDLSAPKVMHAHGIVRRPQFLFMWGFSPQDYLSVLATWQLAFPRARDPRDQGGGCNVFFDLCLGSHMLPLLQYSMGCTSQLLLNAEGPDRGLNTRTGPEGKDHWDHLFQASSGLHALHSAHLASL